MNGNKNLTDVPVTKLLTEFAANLEYELIPQAVLAHLKPLILDHIGVAVYGAQKTDSSDPFYNAVQAISGPGKSTVFTRGSSFQTQYAMLLNGAYSHTLDFDDTYLEGVVHPGASVISAALVEGERLGSTGAQLLTAVTAGYETVCRLALALGNGGFAKGFHNTCTAGIFGAIAAIGSLQGMDEEHMDQAFGIAISKTGGSMQFLENGAWNKRLHPGFAAHDAFLAVSFAAAGVISASKPIEGKHGLLNVFGTKSSDHEMIVKGLGKRWVCLETAIKPYPACRLTHGAIDLATSLRREQDHRSIRSLQLDISQLSYNIVGLTAPNKLHPKNNVDAQFSAYFQTAITWLDGNESGWKVYDRLLDSDVSEMLEKIAIKSDPQLSDLQTRMTIIYSDGTMQSEFCEAPLGEPSNPISCSDVKRKYFSLAVPVFGHKRSKEIESAITNLENVDVTDVMALLACT